MEISQQYNVQTGKFVLLKNNQYRTVWTPTNRDRVCFDLISELKDDFQFDHLLGQSYQANSANLQLSQMAYNLMISMQIDSGLAKKVTKKRTRLFTFMKMKTLRLLVICKAGKIGGDNGRKVLKLTQNKATEALYESIQYNLDLAA